MSYVQRTVTAGEVIEVKKYYSARIHNKGTKRSPNRDHSSEAQKRVNDRRAETEVRWKTNENFGKGDYHLVLHYFDNFRTLPEAEQDLAKFKRILRELCREAGIELKYIACTETKRMTNIHHHLIINKMPLTMIQEAWNKAVKNGGISIRVLDGRKNHAALASYLMKESRSTEDRREDGESDRRRKRFSCSRNLRQPKIEYRAIAAESWRRRPKARSGYELEKLGDGSTERSGIDEITGYAYQEYFQVLRE